MAATFAWLSAANADFGMAPGMHASPTMRMLGRARGEQGLPAPPPLVRLLWAEESQTGATKGGL
jgi:hypothetical protein